MTRSVARKKPRASKNALKVLHALTRANKTKETKPNVFNRHILFGAQLGDHEYRFHATKGWRVQRR